MSHHELFVSAFVYLTASVVSVALAKRFRLSSVLGYLAAGAAIGPFALKLVGEEGADVMHFAEFGVVMMLFLIGLELRPALLWRMRGPILGLGGAQVGVTAVAVAAVAAALGLPWQASLAVGMALSLSSTAVVLKSLQERGLAGTAGGQSAFSVLLFQDMAVIPMLALFPLLATLEPAKGDGGHGAAAATGGFAEWLARQPSWMNTLLVAAAVAAIVLAGRWLFQPILRSVARTGVREAFVALALLLIIGVALAMNALGVSPALGAFLAGVVLADSEYRHELEADIEPFKGLLLGVFFISIGASIDVSLILARPLLIGALVLGLIALKALILFALGTAAKLDMGQRLVFAAALAQGGEFAFVLLGFGVGEGVLPADVGQALIASVTLTMALAPLAMSAGEWARRRRKGEDVRDRPADPIHERHPVILAGIGRFGNFTARLLRSQGVNVTVIDSDADHIEFLRKIGIKAHYGDACRLDLLEAAGAAEASVLIIALDDEDEVNRLVRTARKHFPNLAVMARALSRRHQYQLINQGVDRVVHQNAGSAIQLGRDALIHLGVRAHRAVRVARAFQERDEAAAQDLAEVHQDEAAYVRGARERIAILQEQFAQDRRKQDRDVNAAWDAARLRADTAPGDGHDALPLDPAK